MYVLFSVCVSSSRVPFSFAVDPSFDNTSFSFAVDPSLDNTGVDDTCTLTFCHIF